jgi:CDP-glycerol glycerophosphotransferase
VPLAALRDAESEDTSWELWVRPGGGPLPVRLPETVAVGTWSVGEREVALLRDRGGNATLAERDPRPVVTAASWGPGGELRLQGRLPEGLTCSELTLDSRHGTERFAGIRRDGDRFEAELDLGEIHSLAGRRPLRKGSWELLGTTVDEPGRARSVPVMLDRGLHEALPVATVADHKPFALGVDEADHAVLVVETNLDDDERGPYHQARLRATAYAAALDEPLRDSVVYLSFQGRQYSDSPRAIHEELVRRDAPLEHFWVVRDGRCEVPPTATVLRDGSREFHAAIARARYVVTNDHFPDFFTRRPEQTCLQTWHGTPLKRLGLDVAGQRRVTRRRFERRWEHQVENWQYVLSPNRFSTPILQRAYAIEGEMLETGYPRVDVLAQPDHAAAGDELRRRIGVPEGVRTVLYAPTYRDHVRDRRGRYRLDVRLDIDRLRAAVGEDTVILFRKHHYIADRVPETDDGFVRDVSSYPDGTELMLAADVLLTDYSSMMVDFANTGRPMLFYTYDLDAYRDEIRGFYLDFMETVPGPLLSTTDEVIAALRDLDGVRAAYAARYAAFAAMFCELDDGLASARVVDRLFAAHAGAANTRQERLA